MKKILTITIALAIPLLLVIALYATLAENTAWQEIPDAGVSFQKTFRDRSVDGLLNGGLAVHVKGSIDGTAILHTTYGDIDLAGDNIDLMLIGHEYWNSMCTIEYDPLSVKSGNLSIRVAIGSLPPWARKPLLHTSPANYKGGWRTWHANRKQLYSKGFYRDGQKKGSWAYWDEQGQLIKTEQWKDGKLKDTANK
jgi:hypothetical protein